MKSDPLDGSLHPWARVANAYKWDTLLVGNGLSINIWSRFDYRELFTYAVGGGLTPSDLKLFEGTSNFERVLGDISTAIRVDSICDVETDPLQDRYRRIRRALGVAIRAVHPNRWEVADQNLAAIREHLLCYERIFTISYDLLLYWATGASPNGRFEPFTDLFRWNNRCQFDVDRSDVNFPDIPIYFLHGALHLVVGGQGDTRKLRRTMVKTLLRQFGEPIQGDPQARPLLVTEGSARDKKLAIDRNEYLSYAIGRLRLRNSPIVIFGCSLGLQDGHLIEALNENLNRPVAISLYPDTKRALAGKQADIYSNIRAKPLLFFDSTTHPLGGSGFSSVW